MLARPLRELEEQKSKYSDKIKENELIVVPGYTVMGLRFFFYIIVNSIWILLAVQVLISLGEAIYAPAFDTVYSKQLDDHESSRQWDTWKTINYFTAAFGAIIGRQFIGNKFWI